MKLRMQITVDLELPNERVMERYGSTDPFAVAQSVMAEARRRIDEDAPPEIEQASVTVHPLYG